MYIFTVCIQYYVQYIIHVFPEALLYSGFTQPEKFLSFLCFQKDDYLHETHYSTNLQKKKLSPAKYNMYNMYKLTHYTAYTMKGHSLGLL